MDEWKFQYVSYPFFAHKRHPCTIFSHICDSEGNESKPFGLWTDRLPLWIWFRIPILPSQIHGTSILLTRRLGPTMLGWARRRFHDLCCKSWPESSLIFVDLCVYHPSSFNGTWGERSCSMKKPSCLYLPKFIYHCFHCFASSGAPWRCCRCCRGCRQRHVLGNLPAGFLRHLKELGNTCYPEQSLRVCLELFGQTHYHWIPTNVAKLKMNLSSQLELEIGFDYWGLLPFNGNIQPLSTAYMLSFQCREIWIFMPPFVTECSYVQSESNNKQRFTSYHIIEIYSEYNRAKH